MYMPGDTITVEDRMQRGYAFKIVAPFGEEFAPDFQPRFTPAEMLALGVFEGKYCNDCQGELPAEWFANARISDTPDPALNRFGVKSRQPLSHWRAKGWIIGPDPRGWFQWYCRYWLGRRLPEVDAVQIKRWKAFARHAGQIRAHCWPGDLSCRPRQRQALLQWAHDPFI
jgi:hypothetical protein